MLDSSVFVKVSNSQQASLIYHLCLQAQKGFKHMKFESSQLHGSSLIAAGIPDGEEAMSFRTFTEHGGLKERSHFKMLDVLASDSPASPDNRETACAIRKPACGFHVFLFRQHAGSEQMP